MKRLTRIESGLTAHEYATLSRLSTPGKIQDFLDQLPINWEKHGDTLLSPRSVLNQKKAHSAKLDKGDDDHVVTLYKRNNRWGAISKTNHASIRFRDPVYRTLRELALSYFHEWFLNSTGEKILECYSKPLDVRRFGTLWITSMEDLSNIADALSVRKHYFLVPKGNWRWIRRADAMELKAGKLIEWPRSNART